MRIGFPKPPLTYWQQAVLLEMRGLRIESLAYTEKTLQEINYYRLRGYYLHWFDKTTNLFHQGSHFDKIVSLHRFDLELSRIVLSYILEIEIKLRCTISYVLAHQYDGRGYTDRSNFRDATAHGIFMHKLSADILKASRDKFVEHLKRTYGLPLPIWAAIELIPFGNLSRLFANMVSFDQHQVIAKFPDIPIIEFARSNMHFLTYLRNICAHGGRIYNKRLSLSPKLNFQDRSHLPSGMSNTFFTTMFVIKYFIVDSKKISAFANQIEELIENYQAVEIARLGMPTDWKYFLTKTID